MLQTREKVQIQINESLAHKILKGLYLDKFFLLVLMIIFIKSLLFVGLLSTDKATSINIQAGFFSVPPYVIIFSFTVAVLSFTFLFKGRAHIWALIVADILATTLFIGDAWYFRGFSNFLNYFLFLQGSNLDNLESSIISMARPVDIIFLVDIVILIIYAILNRTLYRGLKRNISLFLATLIIPTCYLTYVHFKVDYFKRCFFGQYAFKQSWSPCQTMSDLGPLGYHIYDTYRFIINSKTYVLSDKEKQNINSWYDSNIEKLPDNEYNGMFKGKNLLIIQWESLENFVINQKIQGQEITPNINKLLKNSLYFDNYHENISNGTSSDADLMTNTGLYPVREGATFFRYPSNTYKYSLPNLLKDQGYSTAAIHPDKASYWNWLPALKSIGFQKCYDSSYYKSTEPIGLGISDHQFLPQAAAIIEKQKQPFYNFVVTLSSHSPFDLPYAYRTMKLTPEFDSNMLGNYFQSMHYTDEQIGKFIDELSSKGLLQNTLVVIYGDHTSVHKFYPDLVAAVRPQEDWWMHNDMRIPLIIYNPNLSGKTISTQAGQVDLLPTVSYLLGVDKNKFQKEAVGKILVNTKKDYTILTNFTMYGSYTKEQQIHAQDGMLLSDKMIQSNYFKIK